MGFKAPIDSLDSFISKHGLPEDYKQLASTWFDPLTENLLAQYNSSRKTLIVGINGCQGSGKTTLADYLSMSLKAHGLKSIAISIDDFYLSHQQRQQLSKDIHPLLATRGVPGTHDTSLAISTLNALRKRSGKVAIPRFNKAQDDRYPVSEFAVIETPLDIIILEGWCVGIEAQTTEDLSLPINRLEETEDRDGHWRQFVNHQLKKNYSKLWHCIDTLIMLKAPSFNCVYQWRLEQEQKLISQNSAFPKGQSNKTMTAEEIRRFIQHYERLTRHSLLSLPGKCHYVFELNRVRDVENSATNIGSGGA
jgi:D-glycerate 3-kinase